MTVSLYAQWPTGEPVVGNTAGNGQVPSLIFLDAMQFSGNSTITSGPCIGSKPLNSDMCGQIQAAICAAPAPTGGVTIDARGFEPLAPATSLQCNTNPFASPTDISGATLTTTPVTLLLPPQNIVTFKTWFLPRFAKVIGQNQTVTTLSWGGGSQGPTNCTLGTTTQTCIPVVCMGNPDPITHNCDTPGEFTNTPRIQISGLRIDCSSDGLGTGNGNMFGLVNITAQEQSWFQNGGTQNCPGAGVFIGPTGHNHGSGGPGTLPDANQVQNSGPFTNLEINWGENATPNTLGMYVQGGPSITVGVGGHITFNRGLNYSGSTPSTALSVNGFQVSVADIHCEQYVDCVLLGNTGKTYSASVHNVTIANNTSLTQQNVVHVSSLNPVTGVVASVGCIGSNTGSTCPTANSIKDDQAGPSGTTYSNQYLASYVIGPAGTPHNLVAHGNSDIDMVSTYNGLPTAGIGVPAVYGVSSKPAVSGSIPTSIIVGSAAGEYTIHYYADQRALCSSSGSVQFFFNWNDGSSRQATPTLPLSTTTTSYIQGAIPVFAAPATGITYSSTLTGCSGGTYDVHVSAEQTQ